MADTISVLRRRVVELEMENKRLLEQIPQTHCPDCLFSVCNDGIFTRCKINGMKVVYEDGYCSDGKRRKKYGLESKT